MQIIHRKTTKANKEHKCNWCNGIILKGELYDYSFNKGGGDVYSWKSHLSCLDLVSNLDMEDDGDGISPKYFHEYLTEVYESIMSEKYNEIYEDKNFKYPPFVEQLDFIKKEYNL